MEKPANQQKRKRSENWLDDDKELLKKLVRERVHVIENKNTDTNTNNKKIKAWSDLCESFNSMCTGGSRSVAQLKTQWCIIKMYHKKMRSAERKALIKSGGCVPPTTDPTYDDDMDSWLPFAFVSDTNEFDTDQITHYEPVVDVLIKEEPAQDVQLEPPKSKETESNEEWHPLVSKVVQAAGTDGFTCPPKHGNTHNPVVRPQPERPEQASATAGPSSKNDNEPAEPQASEQHTKQKNKKKEKNRNYAELIANTEIECRRELHRAQMENEQRKAFNLKLKKELLELKTQYFKKYMFEQ